MINLFFITDSYSETDRYCKELISYLTGYKTIKLHVVYVHSDKKEFLVTKQNSITEIYIPEPLIENFNAEKYYSLCATLLYSQYSHLENVIFHLNKQTMVNMALAIQQRFNCKIVYTLHSLPDNYRYFKYLDVPIKISDSIEELQYKQMLAVSDQIICETLSSENIVKKLFNIPQTKINTIFNGIDFIHPDTNTNKSFQKEQFGFNPEEKVILYVGQSDSHQVINSLINAFKEVLTEFPKTRLVIGGKDNSTEYFKSVRDIYGKVHFLSKVDNEDIHQFYNLADIGIISPGLEQCYFVALEMMNSGTPVIISDGMTELFTHEYDVLKFKLKVKTDEEKLTLQPDETDLAKQIKRLISLPDLANKLCRNAKKKVQRELTGKIMGKQTLEVYKKLITNTTESIRN